MTNRDESVPPEPFNARHSPSVIPLKWIATLMVVGACWVLSAILIPFFLALILAIAFSPLASKLERLGLTRSLASLCCLLVVVLFGGMGIGLLGFEAGTIIRDSDRYIHRFSSILSKVSRQGVKPVEGEVKPKSESHALDSPPTTTAQWEKTIRQGVTELERWLVSGVGGALGVLGGGVVALAFFFYMLQDREKWIKRLKDTATPLGMKPRNDQIEKVQREVVTYLGFLSLVATGYVIVVSLVLWLIGVPQPILWGLLAGMLEVVPYFGPAVASVLPTIVSLSLGGWWQPACVIGMFLTIHLVEGYMITPMVYGRAVKLDPVSILFGAMFFGGIWGPVGLAIATPMMIILRGLISVTPDTPALDAIADVEESRKEPRAVAAVS